MFGPGEPQPRHGPDGEPRRVVSTCREGHDSRVSDVALAADALRELDALYAWRPKAPRRRREPPRCRAWSRARPSPSSEGRRTSRGSTATRSESWARSRRPTTAPFYRASPSPTSEKRARAKRATSRRVQQEGRVWRAACGRRKRGRLLPPRGPLVSCRARAVPRRRATRLRSASRTGRTQFVEPAPLAAHRVARGGRRRAR